MFKFNKKYFFITLLLFAIEILIAKYATGFIRHSIGDYLCVILLYTLIKSFINLSVYKTALFVLIFAFIVEFIQLTPLQNTYPFNNYKILKIIIGTSFSIGDLVAYTLGIITTVYIERMLNKNINIFY